MKLLDNRQMCFFPLKAYNDLFFIILRPRVKKDEETISVPSYVQCIVHSPQQYQEFSTLSGNEKT